VWVSKDANVFNCAGAALTTSVSNLQRDVTELRTGVSELIDYSQHSNDTGNTSR